MCPSAWAMAGPTAMYRTVQELAQRTTMVWALPSVATSRSPGRTPCTAQQHEPAKHPDHDQVEQTESHEPRSWRMHPVAKPQVTVHAEFWSGTGRPVDGDGFVVGKRKHGVGRRTIIKALASAWPEPQKKPPAGPQSWIRRGWAGRLVLVRLLRRSARTA
jgi:hypothetical protein